MLTQAEEAGLEQYGAISPLAIVSLLLGVASSAVLASLFLLVVPLAAIVAAGAALAKIASSQGALVGRSAAVAGLVLALLFASIGVSRAVVRQSMLRSHARQFADEWLQRVREGNLEMAHQLHLPTAERQLPGTALKDYYRRSAEAQSELNAMFAQPTLRTILAAPPDTDIHFKHVEAHFPGEKFDRVDLLYELSSPGGKTTPFVIITERVESDDGGRWRIGAVTPFDPESAAG